MAIYNLGGGGGQPELQEKTATPLITNAQQIIVPDDGYDGLSKVTVNPMPAGALKTPTVNSIGYVSSGVQTAGFLDASAVAGLQLSTQAAKTITPTTYSQTAVASGKYTTGAVTVKGDSNLVANNIKSGVSIFGVSGNYDTEGVVCVKGFLSYGQGGAQYARFLYDGDFLKQYSSYYLTSFYIDYVAQVSTSSAIVHDMSFDSYHGGGGANVGPIAMSDSQSRMVYVTSVNSNTRGFIATILPQTSYVDVTIPSNANVIWSEYGTYEMYAWFAKNAALLN